MKLLRSFIECATRHSIEAPFIASLAHPLGPFQLIMHPKSIRQRQAKEKVLVAH